MVSPENSTKCLKNQHHFYTISSRKQKKKRKHFQTHFTQSDTKTKQSQYERRKLWIRIFQKYYAKVLKILANRFQQYIKLYTITGNGLFQRFKTYNIQKSTNVIYKSQDLEAT